MGLYAVKPGFQRSLRGLEDALVARRVNPDALTTGAVVAAAGGATAMLLSVGRPGLMWLVPVAAFARITLNALDGQVARRTGRARPWGEVLNEVGDRMADVTLLGAVALLPGVNGALAAVALVLSLLTSYAGLAVRAAGGPRQYGGVMAKADRMAVLGVVAAAVAVTGRVALFDLFSAVVVVGSALTLFERMRRGHDALTAAGR
jgi:CDP-diacylglycerol--glycerol-3-phosphate 3-phosphatidyltransferase